jgi:glycosyltransferase involved in cell wall biosynthesis
MKILIVNTYDFGGAAKACLRMHKGLLEIGIHSTLLLKEKTKPIENSNVCPKRLLSFRSRLINKLKRIGVEFGLFTKKNKNELRKFRFLKERPDGLEYYSFIDSEYDITDCPEYKDADLIHLHWVADFLDWKSFFNKNTKPIIWTLHDQNPFLGGEHYAERFLGIDNLGNPISRVRKEVEMIQELELLNLKRNLLNKVKDMWIVSPSTWLMNSSKNSSILNKYSHYLIPYGIPTEIFKPLDINFCREILGLPKEKKILLFVADSVDNSRKGFAFLQRSLELMGSTFSDKVLLCAVGEKSQWKENEMIIELGKVYDERLMAMVYSSADLFVIPSLEDNLPNTMLESLCCGTPVLGFPTGGILDVIDEGINGFICDQISVNGLIRGLNKFLNTDFIIDRESISNNAIGKYTSVNQANEYLRLYKEILNRTQV